MNSAVTRANELVLGEPLDQMLNAECRYPFQISTKGTPDGGGLVLPTPDSPGTGNVVIRGRAGSGKSTLALQLLCEAARRNDHVCGAYISLEETQAHVFRKAFEYGWSPYVWPLNRVFPVNAAASTNELAADLDEILIRPMECRARAAQMYSLDAPWPDRKGPFEHSQSPDECAACSTCPFKKRCNTAGDDHGRCCTVRKDHERFSEYEAQKEYVSSPGIVILPQLLPRPFDPESSGAPQDSIFWPRYRQLDDLLRAAECLGARSSGKSRNVRIVCIDSLNAFGAGGLTRDHLAALFDLFKRRQMLAILVIEENDHGVFAGDSQLDSDTIDFLADMVIRLTGVEEEGYWLRHFQVMKSRHQKHVLGRHPFKMLGGQTKSSADAESRLSAIETLIETADRKDTHDESLKKLRGHLEHWKIGGPWRRRLPPDAGVRLFPSIHTIVAASEHLGEPEETHKHVEDRRMWSTDSLGKMVRLKPGAEPHAFTVIGPATSGKTLIAGNFLLEGLKCGEDVLLIRFSETADFAADGSWAPNAGETGNFSRDALARLVTRDEYQRLKSVLRLLKKDLPPEEQDGADKDGSNQKRPAIIVDRLRDRSEQVFLLKAFLSMFETQKIEYWIHEFREELSPSVRLADEQAHQTERRPLLVEIAMKPGALLPEEFVAVIREVFRWGRHFRQREGFDIRRAALLNVDAIGVGYPLLRHSSTAAELFLSAFAHILRCRKTDLLMTAQTTGVPESVDMMKKAVSLADQVITCEHCDVFGDRYITVRGPGLIEGDMIRGRTPESVPGVLRRQRGVPPEFADYFEVDFTTLQGLVGFSSGHIRRPGVSLQLFEEGSLHAAYNSQVARLVRFALGSATAENDGRGPDDGSPSQRASTPIPSVGSGDAPTVTVDRFDSVNANPFHHSLKLLKDAPLHNTVLRTIDEFAFGKELTGGAQERLLYAHLYYRNVLLLACDEETHKELSDVTSNPIGLWDKVAELGTSPHFTILCDQRAQETLACLAMDGVLALRNGQSAAREEGERPLARYLASMRRILSQAQPLVDGNTPWRLSPAARSLVQKPSERVELHIDRVKQELGQLSLADEAVESVNRALQTVSKAVESPEAGHSSQRYLILCWYSHLRELLTLYQEERKQGSLDAGEVGCIFGGMKVLSLPGGGFTGDWYLDVPVGSVSESLGSGIKNALLQPEEDMKRFVEGVGLPSWPRSDSDFFCTARLRDVCSGRVSSEEAQSLVEGITDFVAVLCPNATTLRQQLSDLHGLLTERGTVVDRRRLVRQLCRQLRKEEAALKQRAYEEKWPRGGADQEEVMRAFARFHRLKDAAESGRDSARAWPGGSVRLSDIMTIHLRANRRSDYKGYAHVRGELYAVMKSLMESRNIAAPEAQSLLLAKYLSSLAARAMEAR